MRLLLEVGKLYVELAWGDVEDDEPEATPEPQAPPPRDAELATSHEVGFGFGVGWQPDRDTWWDDRT